MLGAWGWRCLAGLEPLRAREGNEKAPLHQQWRGTFPPSRQLALPPSVVCLDLFAVMGAVKGSEVIYLRGLMRQSAPITPLMGCVRASFFHSEATLSQASRSPG